MPFGPTHRHATPGRFLHWKVRLLAVGGLLLLIGMVREMNLLVVCALALLLGAFALRFFEKEDESEADEEEPAEDEEPTADEPPAVGVEPEEPRRPFRD